MFQHERDGMCERHDRMITSCSALQRRRLQKFLPWPQTPFASWSKRQGPMRQKKPPVRLVVLVAGCANWAQSCHQPVPNLFPTLLLAPQNPEGEFRTNAGNFVDATHLLQRQRRINRGVRPNRGIHRGQRSSISVHHHRRSRC